MLPRTLLLFLLLTYSAFCQAAKIQGAVNDDSGKPLSGAYVVATLQSPSDHSTFSVVTGSKGDYSLANLPPGKYSICVQVPGGPHLNNCQWATETQATVVSGQTISNQTIAVTEGAVLQIRLDDPKKLIAATDDILLGIALPNGIFQPMRLASNDATGRTYDVAVPKKAAVKVTLISTHVQMTDDKGNGLGPHATTQSGPVSNAATLTVLTLTGPSAVNGPPITFTVTGRK